MNIGSQGASRSAYTHGLFWAVSVDWAWTTMQHVGNEVDLHAPFSREKLTMSHRAIVYKAMAAKTQVYFIQRAPHLDARYGSVALRSAALERW